MARAGAAPGARLADADVASLSSRLAGVAELALPASLLRQGAVDDDAGRVAYVTELLRRDPALFLERHGKLLCAAELRFFDALLDDYEVAFHARALAAAAGVAPARGAPTLRRGRAPPASTVAKNRRLAHLEALERTGFFEEQAMRNRAPLLYHHHVGRFAAAADAPLPAELRDGPLGSRGVAAAMLRAADAADADERLRAALEHEARCQPEEESESDGSEGGDALAAAAAAHDEEMDGEDELDAADGDGAPGGSGDGEVRAMRLAAFGRVMREQFLAGGEAATQVDYAAIDADSRLDDRWARVADADAEDIYFDAIAP